MKKLLLMLLLLIGCNNNPTQPKQTSGDYEFIFCIPQPPYAIGFHLYVNETDYYDGFMGATITANARLGLNSFHWESYQVVQFYSPSSGSGSFILTENNRIYYDTTAE
jgi:hypothetical protein